MPEDEQDLSAAPNGPSRQVGGLVANIGERIQEIVETAERAAAEIQAEAEAAAAKYLQERQREADQVVQERMAELDSITELLAARAATVERATSAFVAETEQVRWRMARLIGDEAPSTQATRFDEQSPRMPLRQAESSRSSVSEAAALRATQMAVAGAGRSDIEQMLREQFGIEDPAEVDDALRTSSN